MTNSNYDDRPERIQVDNPDFPYVVQQDDVKSHVFATISLAERIYGEKDGTLFVIVDPRMGSSDTASGPEMQFAVRHSFAGDDENDSCYVADFKIANLSMTHAYGQMIQYTGWLTEARFYPDGYTDEDFDTFNPFVGLKQDSGEELSGFPYLPPHVQFGKSVRLPVQVKIELYYGVESGTKDAKKYAKSIRNFNAEVDAKKEAERIKQEEEKAERARKHAEWLKTPEGLADAEYEKLIKFARSVAGPRNQEASEELLLEMKSGAASYVEGLSTEETELLSKALNEGFYLPRNYPAYAAFLTTVKGILLP